MLRTAIPCLLLVATLAAGQVPTSTTPAPPAPMPPPAAADAPPPAPNAPDGLQLPADFTAPADAAYVDILATCKGPVRWILTVNGVKSVQATERDNNVITIGLPRDGGQITVFAVGLVDGKLTQPARCVITVKPTGIIQPSARPAAAAAKPTGRLFVAVVVNGSSPPAGEPQQQWQRDLAAMGVDGRIYGTADQSARAQGVLAALTEAGASAPGLVVLDQVGKVWKAKSLPRTEAELVATVKGLLP